MKFQIHFSIRKFEKGEEDGDSGYYDDLNVNKTGKIDVNIEDDAFEQILTIYHEITHFIFDYISQYKLDTEQQKVFQRDDSLKKDWRKFNAQSEDNRKDGKSVEERICCKVERAVAPILRKHIPKDFFKRFFK